MQIDIQRAAYPDVEAMRELYRYEAGCQIIHDSHLRCQLADPYLILVNGRLCGYGGISNKAPHRLIEFYVQPAMRRIASTLLRELLAASGAAAMAAQTNMPLMLMLLYEFAQDITREAILFEDAEMTHHTCTQGVFRQATPAEAATIFPHHHEPVGNWVIDTAEGIVATGGFLTHYNPPYGDIFMEVRESARRRGFGLPPKGIWSLSGTRIKTGLLRGWQKTSGTLRSYEYRVPPHTGKCGIAALWIFADGPN